MTFSIAPVPTIVDASVVIELLVGDEHWAKRFDAWLADNRMLLAPQLFPAEIANGLLRGRRLTAGDTLRRLEQASGLDIEIADRGPIGLREALTLAARHGLTVYDALYLQLAIDVDGELATLDYDLRAAAEAEDIALVD